MKGKYIKPFSNYFAVVFVLLNYIMGEPMGIMNQIIEEKFDFIL